MTERPLARADLRAIPAYRAGHAAPAGAYKVSSNENPFPPLPGVLAAISDAAASANRYPDFGCARLIAAVAAHVGVEPDQIAPGTGSVAVLGQLMNAFATVGDEVILPWRSFEAYPILVQLSGATQVRVPLRDDSSHDLKAMAAAVNEQTRVVMVCTPNNPTGNVVARSDLMAFLDEVPSNVIVAIDEAYAEFTTAPSALDLVDERNNVVVLRTFSKAFGLAGLRVGYAVGPAFIVTELRKAQLPFGVTRLAEQAAIAALASKGEMQRRVDCINAERARVIEELKSAPINVPESEANFVWLPLAERTAEFAAACASAGAVVRSFDGEGVRATIGEPEAADRWLAVLRNFLGV